jgi:hypothetical protein
MEANVRHHFGFSRIPHPTQRQVEEIGLVATFVAICALLIVIG